MGKKNCVLDSFEGENEGLDDDEDGDVQKERFVADVVKIIVHAFMNCSCPIPAQLPRSVLKITQSSLGLKWVKRKCAKLPKVALG